MDMDSLNPTEVLKFLEFVNDLKHLPRRGWIFSKIKDHETISGWFTAAAEFRKKSVVFLDKPQCHFT